MDTLPLELQVTILSNFSFNELAKVRLVSKSVKCSAEDCLKSITRIALPRNNRSLYEDGYKDVCSYIHQEYLCEPFVLVSPNIKFTLALCNSSQKTLINSFFSFLGKYCPNLQVLFLNNQELVVTRDNLRQLPTSLRFFKCYDIKSVASDKAHPLQEVSTHLQALEYFETCLSDQRAELLFKLAQERQKDNKPVAFFNPKVKFVDQKNYECFSVKSLAYDINEGEVDPFHPIYPSIAANLVGLKANFVPTDEYCQAPLPMLKYLSLRTISSPPTYSNNVLFTSPNLKCFRFDGPMDVKLLETIFAHLHSLKYLQVIVMSSLMKSGNRAKVVLPSQVREFTFESSCALDLQSCASASVVKFKVDHLVNLDFKFPDLRQLFLCQAKSPSLPHLLSESLQVSTKLRHLRLEVGEVSTIATIQSIVDACSKCKMLTSIWLVCETEENESDEEQYLLSGEVVVKQDDFFLVKQLYLRLPCDLVFHPNDRFNSLKVLSSLELVDENEELQFLFDCSGMHKLCMKGDMKQLTQVQIHLTRNPWIVEQSKFFTHIEELSLWLGSYGNDAVPTDAESLAKIFSSRKLNSVRLEGITNSTILCKIFDVLLSLELLTEVSLNLESSRKEKNPKKTIAVRLPPKVERMSIESYIRFDFSSELQTSLKYLQAWESSVCSFNCPNLEEVYFEAFESIPNINLLTSLKHSTKLKQLTLRIDTYFCIPSVEYVQELLTIASRMKSLSVLDIGHSLDCSSKKIDGCINIIQSEFASVKLFRLCLPMQIVFHPLDVFKKIIVKDFLCFKSSRLSYGLTSCDLQMLTVLNMSGLDNITEVIFHKDSFNRVAPLAKIMAVKQLPMIQSVFFDDHFSDEFIKFLASLTHLRKLTVNHSFDQDDVLEFLLTTQSNGPLEIDFVKTFDQVAPINHLLHESLNNLNDRGVVSSFVSPWLCQCQGDCWLKKQGTQ